MNTHQALAGHGSAGLAGGHPHQRLLCVTFNQDQGCFAVGHEGGFHVYSTDPVDSRVQRNFRGHGVVGHGAAVVGNIAATGAKPHHQGDKPPAPPHGGTANSSGGTTSASGGDTGGSGIGHVTMLHRTNYLALVGGGKHPRFSNNKLVIWDDLKRKSSLQLEFTSAVLNVLLSRIRIVVVLRSQVLVYGFSAPPKKFASYETADNEQGLADLAATATSVSITSHRPPHGSGSIGSLSSSIEAFSETSAGGGGGGAAAAVTSGSVASAGSTGSSAGSTGSSSSPCQILAFPGRSAGQIQLVDVSPAGQERNLISIIKAHKSKIRCLTLNRQGTLVASASETGTLIRVHSTHNTALLYEFRRGLDRAVITSMKFSHNDSRLAVLSDKNTLHVYNVGGSGASTSSGGTSGVSSGGGGGTATSGLGTVPGGSLGDTLHTPPANRQHLLRRLPIPVPNYFRSTWSFCSVNTNQYHSEEDELSGVPDTGVVGWSGNDSVIIVWKNKGIWEKYVLVERRNSQDGKHTWDIVRDSWKRLDVLP
ncbi:SVP1-like protein 2 [[Candida] anglica]|uniref:SVP1-like protein 2 n=1 Tax=[Candida] anglica TaxID=148631 RepID=A0ABP0EG71_9ASCO